MNDSFTHSIRIDIGIDYAKVLSPENIPGLKIAYGISDEAELRDVIAQRVVDAVSTLAEKDMAGFGMSVINAAVLPLASSESQLEKGNKATDWTPAPAPEDVEVEPNEEIEEDYSKEDDLEEEDYDLADDDFEEIDSNLISLLESINEAVFKLISMSSDDIHIYLNNYSEFGEAISNAIDVETHNINRSKFKELDDLDGIAYIATYKNAEKENKILKVKAEELNNKEEK